MKNQVFHIAGGGIAGLASALAVQKSGGQAMVMEKAARFEALGAGVQLGPNAVRALQKLGAWDAVEPSTFAPAEILIRNGRSGKILSRIELGKKFEQRFGHPYRVAHRADVLSGLLQVASAKTGITITTNAEVIARDTFCGHALIAADGIFSKTREALFPGHSAMTASDTIFRSLVGNAPPSQYVTLWLYPGAHVVHYAVGHPAKLNLVVVTQGQKPAEHFQEACADLQTLLALATDWSQWPAAYVPPLKRWHKDNITLIGDAAHGTLPYLAQGAAMAIEDAASLLAALQKSPEPVTAFQYLSKMRAARTTKLHSATLQTRKIYHASHWIAGARDITLRMLSTNLPIDRLKWIYVYT